MATNMHMLRHNHEGPPGHGPGHEQFFDLKDRHHCTDIPCCIAFLVALFCGGVLYARGLAEGNIEKIFRGINGEGLICGVDEAVKESPYLYWCATCQTPPSVDGVCEVSVDASHPVCVKECPSETVTSPVPVECTNVVEGDFWWYRTEALLDRYCMPDLEDETSQQIVDAMTVMSDNISSTYLTDFTTNVMEDMSSIPTAWPALLASFFGAVLLGYMYLALLRCCAQPLIIITWVVTMVGLIALGGFLWANAGALGGGNVPESMVDHEENLTKFVAVVLWIIGGLLALTMCCFFSSLRAATACIECASEVIWVMPQLLILPIAKAAIKGLIWVLLLYGFLMLWTIAPVTVADNGVTRHFEHTSAELGELCYYIFMWFWIMEFLNALYEFIVAYAVVDWYLQPFVGLPDEGEKDVECCDVCIGIEVGLFMHAGSLAFGSLAIAVLRFVQMVIQYAEKKNKEGPDNAVIGCVLYCANCCIGCCKEILEHINRNAYIDIALTSNSFCEAGHNALEMVVRLGGAMSILNGATAVFTIFGTAAITLGTGAISYAIVNSGTYADEDSENYVDNTTVVLIAACFIGMIVAMCFMDIFDMASDALLYCYGSDLASGNPGHTAPAGMKELFHETQATRHMHG